VFCRICKTGLANHFLSYLKLKSLKICEKVVVLVFIGVAARYMGQHVLNKEGGILYIYMSCDVG
jgi:hypothetical protein